MSTHLDRRSGAGVGPSLDSQPVRTSPGTTSTHFRRLALANTNGGEKIAFGATVTIEDEEGMARRIRIVGIDESDTTDGRISWKSPLGSSLLGKEVGDEIIVKAPAGEREYEVREIEYEEILIEEYVHVGPGESESR